MTTTALTTTTDRTPTTTDPLQLWDEAVSRYLETRKGGPTGNTAKTYGRTLRAYKDFALESGFNPWGADALIAYNKLQNGLRKTNGGDLADDTIAARLTHVQGFFRWAYIHGATLLTPEIVKGFVHKPRVKQLSPRDILDASEVGAMLKVAKSAEDPTQAKREHALIRVMADAGLRVSEAVNLKADDVYLAGGKWYLFVRGKGDRSRDVEVSEDLAQELLALKVADFVPLLNMSRQTAHRWIRHIAREAGVIKSVSPHTLRHTHAHNLRLAGYSLEATSYRLGHADVKITTRYTRPAELSRVEKLPNMPWVA
jgi:site-specific recombinase XerD